jgi:hypothetical protein
MQKSLEIFPLLAKGKLLPWMMIIRKEIVSTPLSENWKGLL